MFYDGNHTYLIEPEENETSQVSALFAEANGNVDVERFSFPSILNFIFIFCAARVVYMNTFIFF